MLWRMSGGRDWMDEFVVVVVGGGVVDALWGERRFVGCCWAGRWLPGLAGFGLEKRVPGSSDVVRQKSAKLEKMILMEG